MNNFDFSSNKQRLLSDLRTNLKNANCVFLCIGSDRITGDCLGPLTGQLLTHNYNVKAYVYGTLERPITALNLPAIEKFIRKRHKNSKVVAIDASLGAAEEIGSIKMQNFGVAPGRATNKNLPVVGDYSITATVTAGTTQDASALFATRLHLVYNLADTIANSISDYIEENIQNFSR